MEQQRPPPSSASLAVRSILDTLGSDIIAVMSPVSICMLLVVGLVSTLAPPSSTSVDTYSISVPTAATLVYQESPFDSTAEKLEGALLNAAVFIALITAVTFLLVLVYYYNYTAFLRHYMRFSAFFVLASMGGTIFVSLLRRFNFPLDALSFGVLVLNFSAVGVFAVLSSGGFPIVMRQAYMVTLGVIVAAWFTKLPEWTTWTLLVALAVYDLVAVLAPRGPLKMLVELSSSRDEELPAFIYEARPSIVSVPVPVSLELQPVRPPANPIEIVNLQATTSEITQVVEDQHEDSILQIEEDAENLETTRLLTDERTVDDDRLVDMTRGIRLGLGDFVFYSVLVGRAAMYDWMTVYACYLAIISGLGCTLALLSLYRKALPALPISVILGVGFYFVTRLLMEPFVVGASSNLVMF